MTKDDIIRMAREAGFRAGHIELYSGGPLPFIAPTSSARPRKSAFRWSVRGAATTRAARTWPPWRTIAPASPGARASTA